MMVDFFRSGDCYQLFDNFISFLMIFCPDQEALARTNTTREQWWRSLMFKTTHDPVDVTNGNTTSLCPVFATCMSWPESVRNKRGAYWRQAQSWRSAQATVGRALGETGG